MNHPEGTETRRARAAHQATAERGQVLVIFAGTLVILLLMAALVIDLAWLWSNSLKIQRAADAAALAGVTYLPGDPAGAYTAAYSGAKRNGYDDLDPTVTVTPAQDASNPRRLDVRVTAPVDTFFLSLIGMDTVTVSRKSKAEYILPVPMGSPLNYYGVYGLLRSSGGGTTTYTDADSGLKLPTVNKGSGWNTNGNVYASDNARSWTATTNAQQAWGGNWNFGVPSGATIRGIALEIEARANDADCQIRAELSWANGGTNWTSGTGGSDPGIKAATIGPTPINTDRIYTLGSATQKWNRTWTAAEFSNALFQVRLTNFSPGSACPASRRVDVDRIRVIVYWTTSAFTPDANVAGPAGEVLTPQGFWGEMLTQGADTSNGDAYLPFYVQSSASRVNPEQKVDDTGQGGGFYDYAVEMQPSSAGGQLYIFDPGFCNTGDWAIGTGDRYYAGSGQVSTFYTLWDTQGTLYDLTDDRLVGTSGNTFRRQSSCDAYHNAWYQLPLTASPEITLGLRGGAAPHVYRLRTTTYDPTDVAYQRSSVSANNSFALLAKGTSGAAPRVYGIGAMEMLTPLPGGQTSTFYLAQIDDAHAGKTMEIRLWDPGDTNQNAYIQILEPTTTGWSAVPDLAYTARRGQLQTSTGTYIANSGASSCDGYSSTSTDRVQTYQSSSRFNGCWLTIQIALDSTYSAPQSGWWKISYVMQGSSGTNATDITTWQVDIRGNPVHLIEP